MMWIYLLAIGMLCAILYRAGGMGHEAQAEPTWIPMWLRQSWVRDWTCPACIFLAMWAMGINIWNWWTFLAYGITGGALSTYWGFINPWFGLSQKDKYWWNWLIAGFFVGLALFPLTIENILTIKVVLLRSIFLGLLWMAWSEWMGEASTEEMGRGAILIATLPLLLI